MIPSPAARSSTARPSDLKSVSSSAEPRPACAPAARTKKRSRICDSLSVPYQFGVNSTRPPFPWSHATIGSVLGCGDTIEDALAMLREKAKPLEAQGLTVHTEALAEGLAAIQKEEKAGIEFTDQAVPEPAAALET